MQEATQTSTSWPENLVCTLAYKNAKEAGGGGEEVVCLSFHLKRILKFVKNRLTIW